AERPQVATLEPDSQVDPTGTGDYQFGIGFRNNPVVQQSAETVSAARVLQPKVTLEGRPPEPCAIVTSGAKSGWVGVTLLGARWTSRPGRWKVRSGKPSRPSVVRPPGRHTASARVARN